MHQRPLYDQNVFHTRVRGRHFGQTITTRPHKPISEAWKAVREQKTVKKWVGFLAISEIFDDFFTTETFQSHLEGHRLMGPRCDRLSKMSSTHSSGGGREHIEASGAS